MADHLDHLPLPRPEPGPHVAVGGRRDEPQYSRRDQREHSQVLLAQINELEGRLFALGRSARPENARGFLYAATFDRDSDVEPERLTSKRGRTTLVDFDDETRRALVYSTRAQQGVLRSKVAQYGDPEQQTKKGRPRNEPLIAPLETLVPVSLADLSDGWLRDDALRDDTWVEIWMGGGLLGNGEKGERARREQALAEFLNAHGLGLGATVSGTLRAYTATEHDIYVVKLSAAALRALPAEMPEVFHLGPPQDTLVPQMIEQQTEGLEIPDVGELAADSATVVVLDTGMAEGHPLLEPVVAAPGASSIAGDTDAADTFGHGTKMAGRVVYENLGAQLAAGGSVTPRCRLQNGRIHSGKEAPEPEPMLERTRDAVLEAERLDAPRRIFNLSLGSRPSRRGDTTPWSTALDGLAYEANRLFCVASGNEPHNTLPTPQDYPDANLTAGLTSPGDALNALTVGAITDLTTLDGEPGARVPLAAAGQLGPFSRCDLGGSRPIKPEIVFEGGNLSSDGSATHPDRAMQLLTTSREFAVGPWLTMTAMTSAATAGVSGLAAQVWQANPNRRPQTIRALIVHSARWTAPMRRQFPEKEECLRAFGYGEPSRELASFSEKYRPTVVFEGQIHPTRKLDVPGSKEKGREMHFHDLPLPEKELERLGDTDVEVSATLSYFTQPNESRSVRYASAGLRWEMQAPLEKEQDFRKRINRLDREPGDKTETEKMPWEIGSRARGRGTVQSDRARVPASDLLGGRAIAVWPTMGWWHDRKIEGDPPLYYSLVLSIDVGEGEVDLYTPILEEISVRTEITD
jgi:hypothetical protein